MYLFAFSLQCRLLTSKRERERVFCVCGSDEVLGNEERKLHHHHHYQLLVNTFALWTNRCILSKSELRRRKKHRSLSLSFSFSLCLRRSLTFVCRSLCVHRCTQWQLRHWSLDWSNVLFSLSPFPSLPHHCTLLLLQPSSPLPSPPSPPPQVHAIVYAPRYMERRHVRQLWAAEAAVLLGEAAASAGEEGWQRRPRAACRGHHRGHHSSQGLCALKRREWVHLSELLLLMLSSWCQLTASHRFRLGVYLLDHHHHPLLHLSSTLLFPSPSPSPSSPSSKYFPFYCLWSDIISVSLFLLTLSLFMIFSFCIKSLTLSSIFCTLFLINCMIFKLSHELLFTSGDGGGHSIESS